MQRKMFDAKQFKHLSSDETTTTLEHADGHRLTIAHSKLSKDMQEQLKALSAAAKTDKNVKPEEPKKMAMGGTASNETSYQPPVDEYALEASTAPIEDAAMPIMAGAELQMPPEGATLADMVQVPAGGVMGDPGTVVTNEAAAPMGITPTMGSTQAASAGIAPDGLQPASAEASTVTDPNVALESGMSDAYNMYMQGQKQQATATGKLGAAQHSAQAKHAQDLWNMEVEEQNHRQQAQYDSEAAEEAVREAKIDPDKYWTGDKDGNGSHSRIAATIGILLAGFNPTNNPNMAVQMLQKQMDRSIEAQKENLGTKKTLLEANFKKYNNIKEADAMTRMQMNARLQNELGMAAAQAQGPLAKAAALQAQGVFKQQFEKDMQTFTKTRMLNTLTKSMNSDPTQMDTYIAAMESIDPARAKDLRGRKVSGFGFADTPEGAKNVNELQIIRRTVNEGVQRLKQMVDSTGKSLNPNMRKEAQTIQSSLVGLLRVPMTGPGAMSEGERELLLGMIANPTNFFSIDSNSRTALDTLQKRIDSNLNSALTINGLKGQVAQPPVERQTKDGKTALFDPTTKQFLRYK